MNDKIIIQLANPERKYVRVYQDFLDNSFLTAEEQMVFIALKSFVDFRDDSGTTYPSMATIARRAKMGEKRVRKNINLLIKKGVVSKTQRGLTKTNIYTLDDSAAVWACANGEEAAVVARTRTEIRLSPQDHIEALRAMGYEVTKKKEPESAAPGQVKADSSSYDDTHPVHGTTDEKKSQVPEERYDMAFIRDYYDYDVIIANHPYRQQEIDSVIDLLHSTLNTGKDSIKIGGDDKPAEVVRSRLLKLDGEAVMYALDKYGEQTGRIKNPAGYMLTILYNAAADATLDAINEVAHDFHS